MIGAGWKPDISLWHSMPAEFRPATKTTAGVADKASLAKPLAKETPAKVEAKQVAAAEVSKESQKALNDIISGAVASNLVQVFAP